MANCISRMNLKLRFSLITMALVLTASAFTYVAMRVAVMNVVEEWGAACSGDSGPQRHGTHSPTAGAGD